MKQLILLLCVFLASCATSLKPSLDSRQVKDLDAWQIKGRIAIKLDNEGGSASFIWDKTDDSQRIELFGPLGSARILLSQSAQGASILDNKTVNYGESLQALLYQRSGWLIPIDALQYWIVGEPKPNVEVNKVSYVDSTLHRFEQLGWQVNYDQFVNFSGYKLPGKLTLNATTDYLQEFLSLQDRQIVGIRVKLIVKSFTGG